MLGSDLKRWFNSWWPWSLRNTIALQATQLNSVIEESRRQADVIQQQQTYVQQLEAQLARHVEELNAYREQLLDQILEGQPLNPDVWTLPVAKKAFAVVAELKDCRQRLELLTGPSGVITQLSLRHWHAFDYKHQPHTGQWVAVLESSLLNTRVHLREFSNWTETLNGIAKPLAWTPIPVISETLITRGPPKPRKRKTHAQTTNGDAHDNDNTETVSTSS